MTNASAHVMGHANAQSKHGLKEAHLETLVSLAMHSVPGGYLDPTRLTQIWSESSLIRQSDWGLTFKPAHNMKNWLRIGPTVM